MKIMKIMKKMKILRNLNDIIIDDNDPDDNELSQQ